jgi:hypothetical protein
VVIPTRLAERIAASGTTMPRSSMNKTSPHRSAPYWSVVTSMDLQSLPGELDSVPGARPAGHCAAITSMPSSGAMARMKTTSGTPSMFTTAEVEGAIERDQETASRTG